MFKRKYLDVNAKKILLVYKTQARLGKVIETIIESAPNKYYYLKRGKNLIWALLIQGILNDRKIDQWIEEYGSRLSIETNFGEICKDIALKKIKPLINELISDSKIAKSIEEEKFTFLKSKSSFDVCIRNARDKFEWDKKDL